MIPEQIQEMTAYIRTAILRNSNAEIGIDTALISSGMVDSLALVDILMHLQCVTGRRIPAGKVQLRDLDTINKMFATAERVGRPQR